MELCDLLAVDEVVRRVGEKVTVTEYGIEHLSEICNLKRDSMLEIGLSIGYRIKTIRPDFDLEQFSDALVQRDPKLHERFEPYLGEPAIHDLWYSHVQLADTTAAYRTVAELLAAIAYPNVLHIADVEFSNPRRPVPEQNRVRSMSRFKGLGLLPLLVERSIQLCRHKNLSAVCVTPAAFDLVPLFESLGFRQDQNPLANQMRNAGMPGPMSLVI